MSSKAHREVEHSSFSESIHSLRLAHYLTTAELAKRLDIDETDLEQYESGEVDPPPELLHRIAEMFGEPSLGGV